MVIILLSCLACTVFKAALLTFAAEAATPSYSLGCRHRHFRVSVVFRIGLSWGYGTKIRLSSCRLVLARALFCRI